MREFKSFYKTVTASEGSRCHYNTRLDCYGCGCQHDCSYCYAKSLLDFRGMWNPDNPSVADIKKIERKIKRLAPGTLVRLGGMTDCFQPMEKVHRVTSETIKLLNRQGVHYLIVTKSDLVADYMDILDKTLAHIQISITWLDCERAVSTARRIKAVESLQENGFDVSVRLSPFVPEKVDFKALNAIKCDKILIEFLRVNHWIEKWLNENTAEYTLRSGAYRHLPLESKLEYLKPITGFEQMTVCEDVPEHYEFWKKHFNYDSTDCCNLRKEQINGYGL